MTKFTKEDVGREVKCACMGNGVIKYLESGLKYPVIVVFPNNCDESYTTTGKLARHHTLSSLSFGYFEEDHNE